MLQNAYFLEKISADTAENEQHFAEILPRTGRDSLSAAPRGPRRGSRAAGRSSRAASRPRRPGANGSRLIDLIFERPPSGQFSASQFWSKSNSHAVAAHPQNRGTIGEVRSIGRGVPGHLILSSRCQRTLGREKSMNGS